MLQPQVVISELNIFPVKSAAGLSLQTMDIGLLGPAMDRRWMVVDSRGSFITQRQCPRLCLIHTALSKDTLQLSTLADDSIELGITACEAGRGIEVGVWGDRVDAVDCGDAAAKWLSDFLGVSVRLCYMPDTCRRAVDASYARNGELVSFADGFPILLISQASLDRFNQHLESPIAMRRFRPNIVVSGCEPFAEDTWSQLRVGGLEFAVAKPCSRCVIPSINPARAEKEPEVSRALARTRRRDGQVFFGQNVLCRGLGSIRVGESVQVLA